MSLIPVANTLAERIAAQIISNPALLITTAAAITGISTNLISGSVGLSGFQQVVWMGAGTALALYSIYQLHENVLPEVSELLRDEIRIATLEEVNELAGSIETLSYVYVAGAATVMVIYMLK